MNADLICILAGPVITLLVAAFKRLAFVDEHPKVVAFILSVIFSVVSNLTGLVSVTLDVGAIAQCVIVPFMTAVGSFEVVKSAARSSI